MSSLQKELSDLETDILNKIIQIQEGYIEIEIAVIKDIQFRKKIIWGFGAVITWVTGVAISIEHIMTIPLLGLIFAFLLLIMGYNRMIKEHEEHLHFLVYEYEKLKRQITRCEKGIPSKNLGH